RGPNQFTVVTQYAFSNAARIDPRGRYVFVALPEAGYHPRSLDGKVAVIDGDPTSANFNDLIAKIPVGQSLAYAYPTGVAVTPDNTRAYVTLRGSNRVAVVDAVTLQEVNVRGQQTGPANTKPIPAPL